MGLEKKRNFIINVAYWALIVALIVLGIKIALPAAVPFIIGFFIALTLRKPIKAINKYIKIPYKISAILVVLWFYTVIVLIIASVGIWLWYGVEALIHEMPNIYHTYVEQALLNLVDSINEMLSQFSKGEVVGRAVDDIGSQVLTYISSILPDVSMSALNGATGIAKAVPGIFIKIVLVIISTFFVAIDYDKIIAFFKRCVQGRASYVMSEIKNYITGTLWVVIRSYLTIMTITFIELSIGLTLIGLKNSVLIALLIAIFDIMPVLGTGGIMIPWAVINLILGDYTLAISLLALYVIITIIRNIIEPKIVGKQLGLHPLVTLVSMFIGLQLAGIVGMLGLPITLSLLIHLNHKEIINLNNRIV